MEFIFPSARFGWPLRETTRQRKAHGRVEQGGNPLRGPRRGTGLGRHIVAAAEAWLIARQLGRLELRVHEDNRHAQGFYAHLGFRETGLLYYRKDLVLAVKAR